MKGRGSIARGGELILRWLAALGLIAALAMAGPSEAAALQRTAAQRITAEVALASTASEDEGDLLVVLRPLAVRTEQVAAQLQARYGMRALASWKMQALDRDCIVFAAGREYSLEYILRQLGRDPRVEAVQLNQLFELSSHLAPVFPSRVSPAAQHGEAAASDPHAGLQYAPQLLEIAAAHRQATGRGVTVGIIDTGVDFSHPELEGRIAGARNFVRHDERFTGDVHGTAIAGVIAATTGNTHGIVGVAPGSRVEALKACWYPEGESAAVCSSYTLALALDYAIEHDLEVLNLSLGGPSDPLLRSFVEVALERGSLVVGPATGAFPGSVPGVVAVLASDAEGRLWDRNSSEGDGPAVEGRGVVIAPGAEILSLAPQSSYDFFSGGSLAAAHVSGVAALLREAAPELSPQELIRVLQQTAVRPSGHQLAIVNACRALERFVPTMCQSGAEASSSTPLGGN